MRIRYIKSNLNSALKKVIKYKYQNNGESK